MNHRRKIAIATAALAMIFVVSVLIGHFDFSYMGSGSVYTVTLADGKLYSGLTGSNFTSATSNFTFTLSNPGSTTQISSISISGDNKSNTSLISSWGTGPQINSLVNMNYWNCPSSTIVVDQMNSASTYTECDEPTTVPPDAQSLVLNGGTTQSFTFFPMSQNTSSIQIIHGSTYNFVINFPKWSIGLW